MDLSNSSDSEPQLRIDSYLRKDGGTRGLPKDRAGRAGTRGGPDRGFPESRPAAERGPPAALLETGGRALSAAHD